MSSSRRGARLAASTSLLIAAVAGGDISTGMVAAATAARPSWRNVRLCNVILAPYINLAMSHARNIAVIDCT